MPGDRVANSTKRWNVNPLHVGMGYFDRWEVVDKFGKNEDVDTIFETVNVDGSIVQLSSAETVNVISNNANDDIAGTGAQKIEIQGLDGSHNFITEEVELAGSSTAVTTKTFLRFFRAKVIQVGAGITQTNIADIQLQATTTTTVTTRILAGEGQTQTATYTIPRGMTGYFEKIFLSTNTNNIITGQLRVKSFGMGWQVKREKKVTSASPFESDLSGSGSIPEKSDVEWRAKADNPNNEVTAGFKILLYKN